MGLHFPKTKPQDYGAKAGDYHLIFNASTKRVKAFEFSTGKQLWEKPCLATGQYESWWRPGGDTPPGVWYLGEVTDDKANGTMQAAYGWIFFDMVDCEGREDGNGRAGLGLHGGGSAAPAPLDPYQVLLPTLGCLRMHNQDLYSLVYPLYKKGKVWVSVIQDDL
jgi:hypothetical protein